MTQKKVFGTPSKTTPIEISGKTKVKSLRDQFKSIFALTLRVYNADGAEADDNATLAAIRAGEKVKDATVHMRIVSKVQSVPVFFKREIGIMVDVFSADNTDLPTKNVSLKAAAEGRFGDENEDVSGDADDEILEYFSENNKEGYKNVETGEVVVPAIYDEVSGNFENGFAWVKLDDKYGLIDITGKEVIEIKYDFAANFSEGLSKVRINDKCGFINKDGKIVIELKYDSANDFRRGLAKVKFNGKWGFINKDEKEVIKIKYDYIFDKNVHTKMLVQLDGEEFYMDEKENRIE